MGQSMPQNLHRRKKSAELEEISVKMRRLAFLSH
jgi:hypothetical protein